MQISCASVKAIPGDDLTQTRPSNTAECATQEAIAEIQATAPLLLSMPSIGRFVATLHGLMSAHFERVLNALSLLDALPPLEDFLSAEDRGFD